MVSISGLEGFQRWFANSESMLMSLGEESSRDIMDRLNPVDPHSS